MAGNTINCILVYKQASYRSVWTVQAQSTRCMEHGTSLSLHSSASIAQSIAMAQQPQLTHSQTDRQTDSRPQTVITTGRSGHQPVTRGSPAGVPRTRPNTQRDGGASTLTPPK